MACYLWIIDYLKRRKIRLSLFLVLTVFICISTIKGIRPDTSIYAMLPSSPEVLEKFKFLQGRSSLYNIILHIQKNLDTDESEEEWLKKIAALCSHLNNEKLFLEINSGRNNSLSHRELKSLFFTLPFLFDESFEKEVSILTEEEGILKALKSHYKQWLLPSPSPFAKRMGEDPLLLVPLLLKEFQGLTQMTSFNCELKEGYYRSLDGNSLFIFIKTSSDLMDTRQSKETISRLETLLLPYTSQLKMTIISPLIHALWNEKIMIRDAAKTMLLMSVGLLLIIVFAFRQWKALIIYIIPMLTILPATFILYLVSGKISALALGIGALISGITVDFCIHIYIALKANDGDASKTMKQIHQPLFISFCTTFFAFGAFLFSSIEGFRQIALFAMANLLFSYLASIIFIPLFNIRHTLNKEAVPPSTPPLFFSKFWIWLWILLMGGCLFSLKDFSFQSRLEQFDGIPESIKSEEEDFFKAAGRKNYNELVVTAETKEQVLTKIEELKFLLKKNQIEPPVLFRFLFSDKTSLKNKKRWENFWKINKEKVKEGLLKQAPSFGFDSRVFAPFLDYMEKPFSAEKDPSLLLKEILSSFVFKFQNYWFASFPLSSSLESKINSGIISFPEGVFLFKKEDFFKALASHSKKELLLFGFISAFFTLGVLTFELKNWRYVFLTMLPVFSSVLGFLGVMSFLGLTLNPAHFLSLIMVIGLAEDYANFMLDYCRRKGQTEAYLSVALSAITTLLGSGILSFAEHPVLKSIGVTVFAGILFSLLASLWVIPAFYFYKRTSHV